ncbi:hypothetical protein AFK68_30445 [Hydrocoleum sp. CS-953]|uniref:discoidin domain-containing protein n=1 Tax=Hydrocoleum sp. CS-953 TaxID=1671698 RepID=UPI000B9BC0B4|nr:discoidin domain-containing protein [Hydrocoleum sp. CS-953]OZH51523.1 hypothetical protein AFK68_30445 [Hydrocoleum sp. CS-953]
MLKKLSIAAATTLGLTMLVDINPAQAALIVSPVDATATSEFTPGGEIINTINQSGLSIGFTSGVDDFDTYLAQNPLHTLVFAGNEWFSNFQGPNQTITYDLGSILAIDRLALWNEEGAGISSFNILSSNDGVNFSTILSGVSPINNPINNDYSAEVIDFGSVVNAQFVQFEITGCENANLCGIGEVAFATAESLPEAVPEPTALLGLLGAGALGATSLKRKQEQEK